MHIAHAARARKNLEPAAPPRHGLIRRVHGGSCLAWGRSGRRVGHQAGVGRSGRRVGPTWCGSVEASTGSARRGSVRRRGRRAARRATRPGRPRARPRPATPWARPRWPRLLGDTPPDRDARLRIGDRARVAVVAGEGPSGGDDEPGGGVAGDEGEHGVDARGLDPARPRVGMTATDAIDSAAARKRSWPGGLSTMATSSSSSLAEGAGEEPLGRRLDHRQPLEPLVVGDLDPLGRAAPAGRSRRG